MILKSGIISRNKKIELENSEIIPFLYQLLEELSSFEKKSFNLYKERSIFRNQEFLIIDYFVKFLGFVVVYNDIVYYQDEIEEGIIDRIEYIKNGYTLKKCQKMIYKDGVNKKYLNPIQEEIQRVGFSHAGSDENELSYWYPKTKDIGFKTPNTLITDFSGDEVELIKRAKWDELNKEVIMNRIIDAAKKSKTFNLDNELFIRFGTFSNKFNFDTCHIHNLNELYSKLMIIFEDMFFKLEWQQKISLVLREYIKTNYKRATIYNGMPLNTEFRVFYDFDSDLVLGIYNYWDKNTMLDNLHDRKDIIEFANTAYLIEDEFKMLEPKLREEVSKKLSSSKLNGKWSVDFLYDGKEFILIDMAHAECSYYYDKVLKKQLY